MDKSREAELAAALGRDWEYVEDVGYCYKGNHQQERAVIDKAICNRVRELCTNPEVAGGHGIKLEYYGDYSECELYEADTCKDILRWDGDMKDEQKEFWEEALLLLAEKGEKEK